MTEKELKVEKLWKWISIEIDFSKSIWTKEIRSEMFKKFFFFEMSEGLQNMLKGSKICSELFTFVLTDKSTNWKYRINLSPTLRLVEQNLKRFLLFFNSICSKSADAIEWHIFSHCGDMNYGWLRQKMVCNKPLLDETFSQYSETENLQNGWSHP